MVLEAIINDNCISFCCRCNGLSIGDRREGSPCDLPSIDAYLRLDHFFYEGMGAHFGYVGFPTDICLLLVVDGLFQ